MQFLKLLSFSFNSYLQRRNILSDNPNRFQILQCPKLLQYVLDPHKNYLQQIIKRLSNKRLSDFQRLKLIMVIHLALSHGMHSFQKVMQIYDNSVSQYSHTIETNQQRISLQIKLKQLVELYLLFIKKICSIPEVYKLIPSTKSNGDVQYTQQNSSASIEEAYILINLIKSTASINKIVMFMGRYAKESYPVIIDFTILISYDLSRIYKHLLRIRKWMMSNFSLFKQYQQKLVINIIDQIYSVRELVEYFIYNKYYYKFINIDTFKQVAVDKNFYKNTKKSQIASFTNDVDLTNFQQTYFTLASENQQKKSKIAKSTIF